MVSGLWPCRRESAEGIINPPFLDLAYQKNPPAGFPVAATDVVGGLERIRARLQKNDSGYANEYAFQYDTYLVFDVVRSGHFNFQPDLLTTAFTFGRLVPLVSISSDGIEIPKLYAYGRSLVPCAGCRY